MKRFWRLYRHHYRDTLRLGLPVMISQIGQITVAVVDNMMIGRLGATQLAAAAFANMLVSLPLYFGMGFALSITPLVGKAYGKGDLPLVGKLWRNGFVAYTAMAALLLVVSGILYSFMPHMNQPTSILPISQPYYIYIAISMFPMLIFMLGKQLLEGLGNTRVAMVITLLGNLINIVGNYLLIFGKMGAPELGVSGAGVSTLVARCLMAVGIIALILRKPLMRQALFLSEGVRVRWAGVKRYFTLGIPMGLNVFSEASAFIFAGLMMGWLGEVGLAAHQIVINLSGLGFMLYQAIAISTTIRVSQLSAKNELTLIKRASTASTQIVGVMVLIISSLFLIFYRQIPLLFTQDADVVRVASQLILVFILFQMVDAAQVVFSGILRGLADAKIPSLFTFISFYLISIPISYVAAFRLGYGEVGIWMGFPIGLAICALLYHIRIKLLFGRMDRKRVPEVQGVPMLVNG